MVEALPEVAARLLGGVPMLDDVLAIIRGLEPGTRPKLPAARATSRTVSLGISVLRSAIDLETYESRGLGTAGAIASRSWPLARRHLRAATVTTPDTAVRRYQNALREQLTDTRLSRLTG
jgi:hypothetical protein